MAKVDFCNVSTPIGFLIVPDDWDGREESSTYIQTDWDYPAVARCMGWKGDDTEERIVSAYYHIQEREGISFPALDDFLPKGESRWKST